VWWLRLETLARTLGHLTLDPHSGNTTPGECQALPRPGRFHEEKPTAPFRDVAFSVI